LSELAIEGARLLYVLISNMHSNSGGRLSQRRGDFWVNVQALNVRSTLRALGYQMPSPAGQKLLHRLRRTHAETLPSKETVSQILAGATRASAGGFVSHTALITTLERRNGAYFDVVNPNAKPGEVVDLASPYFVTPGQVMVMLPNRDGSDAHGDLHKGN
jgi:hypothetical protein